MRISEIKFLILSPNLSMSACFEWHFVLETSAILAQLLRVKRHDI